MHTHTDTNTAKGKERKEIGRFGKGEGSPFPLAKFALATLSVGMVRDQLFSAGESQGSAHQGDGKLKSVTWR